MSLATAVDIFKNHKAKEKSRNNFAVMIKKKYDAKKPSSSHSTLFSLTGAAFIFLNFLILSTYYFLYMNQPPEPGIDNTRQTKYPFMIPSIIMDEGGKYPPFFDVRTYF